MLYIYKDVYVQQGYYLGVWGAAVVNKLCAYV